MSVVSSEQFVRMLFCIWTLDLMLHSETGAKNFLAFLLCMDHVWVVIRMGLEALGLYLA